MAMAVDLSEFEAGSEWVYRLRDSAPSERARIREVLPKKTRAGSRVVLEFLDTNTGVARVEEVPIGRLRVPWAEVEHYDLLMANWDRIDDTDLDDAEKSAMWTVFEQLIPEDIAETGWESVRDHLCIHAPERLPELGIDLQAIIDQVEWFEHDDDIIASPAGSLLLAEAACSANPVPILEWVTAQDAELREKSKRGGERQSLEGKTESTSPEWEYDWYLRWHRPIHEIIRQWCGYRAVTFHERLAAAEAENQRLDILLARAIDDLKSAGKDFIAEAIEEEHEMERITPHRVRPVVERPLSPRDPDPVHHATPPLGLLTAAIARPTQPPQMVVVPGTPAHGRILQSFAVTPPSGASSLKHKSPV